VGLYDSVRSSYNLGEDLTEVELQTKDIGSTMDFYWISPIGQLWSIDVSNTTDFMPVDDKIFGFKLVPNGNRGKVKPVDLTNYIKVYTVKDNKFLACKIHFKRGIVQDVTILKSHNLDEYR
jgi:hypothetical protein